MFAPERCFRARSSRSPWCSLRPSRESPPRKAATGGRSDRLCDRADEPGSFTCLSTTQQSSTWLPARITDAMKLAFASVRRENFTRGEKGRGGSMRQPNKVYELRIYHAAAGKMDNLVARFRDHTMKLFANHGIKSVAYWTALDEPVKSGTFFLHSGASEPGSSGSELESLPGRSGVEKREGEIGREWEISREHRFDVLDVDGLLAALAIVTLPEEAYRGACTGLSAPLLRPLEGHLYLSFIPAFSAVIRHVQTIDKGVVVFCLVPFADRDTRRIRGDRYSAPAHSN
jgi:NIPSNAP